MKNTLLTIKNKLTYNLILRQLKEAKLLEPTLIYEFKYKINENIPNTIQDIITYNICKILIGCFNNKLGCVDVNFFREMVSMRVHQLPFGFYLINLNQKKFYIKNINNLISILVCICVCDIFHPHATLNDIVKIVKEKKFVINIF